MVQKENNLEFEIILDLIKGESHLREIARNLNTPHATVLRKINELTQENILDYKTQGKNKIFFLQSNLKAKNHVYSAEIYKLSKLLKKHPELGIIFDEIKKNFKKNIIILFGSYAKGNETKNSDIDIYLESTNNKIKNTVEEINSKINVKIGNFNTSSLLIKEMIKNHVIVRGVEEYYEKNKFFKET